MAPWSAHLRSLRSSQYFRELLVITKDSSLLGHHEMLCSAVENAINGERGWVPLAEARLARFSLFLSSQTFKNNRGQESFPAILEFHVCLQLRMGMHAQLAGGLWSTRHCTYCKLKEPARVQATYNRVVYQRNVLAFITCFHCCGPPPPPQRCPQ